MGKQILIVDDEISILKLLNFVLSKNYELVIKSSGIEAMSWLEEGNDPDLIISDLHMPYFDGGSFIYNLKMSGFYRDTPIIVLSGETNLEERVNQMPFKIEASIAKPFRPNELQAIITKNIRNYDRIG